MSTHRLMSLLMILASAAGLLATELNSFPPPWHPYIVAGAAVLLALSQSVQQVAKGQ
jgi:hypothetical protein